MRWLTCLLIMAACGGKSASDVIDGPPAPTIDAAVVPPIDAQTIFERGTRGVAACKSLGIGIDECSYTFAWAPVLCSGKACKRLVIYFAGGQETCPAPDDANSYLGHYVTRGYVAVCARAFTSASGSAQFPRNREAPRFDALVKAITSDPDILAGWSGEYLLFSGVSHGASGPVIAMARTAADDDPHWKGTKYTGACFLDGTYDAAALLDFTYTNQCKDSDAIVSYARTYGRYCSFGAADGNQPATWPAPGACGNSVEIAADSITAAPATALAIKDWKLIECGSAHVACSGPTVAQDVLPASSITALCGTIAGTAGYTCEPGSFPDTGHLFCGIDSATIGACSTWFEAQLSNHALR
jgi:hypothetical protein